MTHVGLGIKTTYPNMKTQFRKLSLLLFVLLCTNIASVDAQVLLPLGSTWKYLDNGSDQGTAWKETSFDDAAWSSGPAQLGYGDGDESTIVTYGADDQNKHITTYFRKTISIADASSLDNVKLTLNRDDGAVVYINGVEALRSNMPEGVINHQTFSSSNNEAVISQLIPASFFVTGNNVIAVSMHQTNLTSSDLSFDLALENIQERLVIGPGTLWKYLDNGTNQGTAWRDVAFDDAAWQSGLAPLGYVMTGVVTNVSFGPSSSNKYPTTYYRKKVNLTTGDLAPVDSILVTFRLDDGGVLYINGTEVMRRNMPTGNITSSSFANATVGSAPQEFTAVLSKNVLIEGENTFAVEIHQVNATSSDTYFDVSVDFVKPDLVLAPAGSAWKYNDLGLSAATGWTDLNFDDAAWSSGNAALGYGNGDEATTISYGSDAVNKHITTYFRKVVNVSSTAGYANLQLLLQRDDAAVVHLNGSEVYRNNITSGTVTHSTKALRAIEGAEETQWLAINLPLSLLLTGDNSVAVEIHKFNATESDVRFDCKIALQELAKTQTPNTSIVTCDPTTSDKIGCFTSVRPSAQTGGFIIPSTHTFQLIAKQGQADFYKNSTRSMPSNHDFTGYVSQGANSKQGIVAVNHENDPGDVSLLSVHLNDESMTWVLDSARLVDFTALVRTTRNCSGGVTPWETIITSEETYTTADANADGYQDRGWQVEIDPISGKIMDYNNDGNPDKIWRMGRMSHENIAVSAVSAIAYQAEDGGSSGVYKYVMDVKGKMNNGTLWVLRRDNSTSTTATWVQVPNTTQSECNTVSSVIGALGGTNWNGPEDVEFGPDGKMYFTSKGTGTIWRFKDDGTTVSELEAWVTNRNYPITHSEGTVNESFGTGIDNLTFDGEGNLWAMQDGGRGHLWVIRPEHTQADPKVELFAVTPSGSESTGLTFTPDYKYGFISIQHPGGNTDLTDAAGNTVRFNAGATIVFARKEYLGANAIAPSFDLGTDLVACEKLELTANTTTDVLNVWENNSTEATLEATATGWYKVTAYANNGKMFKDSVYVTINEKPVLNLGADVTSCDEPVALTAGDETYTYEWNNSATSPSIVATATGDYHVVKTNPATTCVAEDEVHVDIYESPALDLGEDIEQCGGSVILTAGDNNYSYEWSTEATSASITVSNSAEYTVVKTDPSTLCSSEDEVLVEINPLPVVSLGPDVNLCASCPLTLDAGAGFATYLWNNSTSNRTLEVVEAGTYTVTVTDANGCEASSSVLVTRDIATSIDELLTQQNGFVVLQHIQNKQVSVVLNLTSSTQLQLILHDLNGNVVGEVANGYYDTGMQTWKLDQWTNQLTSGMYIVNLQAGEKSESRRFIVY
ncbi:MAG: putative phosphatase [Cytophagaceae bacterium]|nr:putative phosphatase [Cytophagaceae bacterium]